MRSKIIEQLNKAERASFARLDPVDRMLKMEQVLHEMLGIKAAEEGVSVGEIYRRYLERDKRRRHAV